MAGEPSLCDRSTPVLILKMSAQPLHHGTLGLIRSLGRAGAPVYCSRESGAAPAARSRYVSGESVGVLSLSDPELSIAQLNAFQSRIGRPVVIVPVDDKGALFLAENADGLRPHFLMPSQSPSLPRALASKARTPELCATVGVATPRTFVVATAGELAAASGSASYPAVMKIAEPWLAPPGLSPTILARNRSDAVEYWSRLRAGSSAGAVIQEYIPEDQAEDWFYHGYYRERGEQVVGFTGRKLRSYPPFLGATSYAVSQVNEDVLALSQRVLRKVGYAGIVELEFRFDTRDRQYKLIDVNPRLGAQFQLLRNRAGVDVARALHLDLTGREVPGGRQVEGIHFLSDFTDAAAFAAYWRRKMVTPFGWLAQVVEAEEHAWFAGDDMAPFGAAFGQFSKRFFLRTRHQPPPPAPSDTLLPSQTRPT